MQLTTFRRKWLAPLVFFEVYLSVTVALFFFGPWPWSIDNKLLMAAYLISSQLLIAAGYLLSWPRLKKTLPLYSSGITHRRLMFGLKFLKLSVFITFLFMIPTSLSRTGSIFPDFISGLTGGGQAYNRNFERLEFGNRYVLVEYMRMLFSPFLVAVFPLAAAYATINILTE